MLLLSEYNACLEIFSKYLLKSILVNYIFLFLLLITSSTVTGANWYINDGVFIGDTWCTAAGVNAVAPRGTTAATPLASLSYLVANRTLNPGDIVYIDKGTYTDAITFTASDQGSSGSPITIIGAGKANTLITNTNTVFTFTAASYITITNLAVTCSSNSTGMLCAEPDASSNYIIFDNCLITRSGTAVEYAMKIRGAHNTFRYNTVNCNYKCLNFMGTDNIINDNIITGTNRMLQLDNSDNTVVRNNILSGGTQGVFIDNGTVNATIQNNYIYNTTTEGIGTDQTTDYSCDNNKIYFNSIYAASGSCIEGFMNGWDIRNNIFYDNSASGTAACFKLEDAANDPAICNNNLYYRPSGANVGSRNGTTYAAIANWKNKFNSNDANSLEVNPGFTSPTTGDLTITKSSPAYTKGADVTGITDDIVYTTRTSATPDIGAYEVPVSLPVELLSFTVKCNGEKVLLNWTTASEKNNKCFVIERSDDALLFNPIEIIAGAGNSNNLKSYSFVDENAPFILYYRLKQIDVDAVQTTSETIVSNCTDQNINAETKVFYDKANKQIVLFFNQTLNGNIKYEIYDYLGKRFENEKIPFQYSNFKLLINTTSLHPGIYLLKYVKDNVAFTSKILLN